MIERRYCKALEKKLAFTDQSGTGAFKMETLCLSTEADNTATSLISDHYNRFLRTSGHDIFAIHCFDDIR